MSIQPTQWGATIIFEGQAIQELQTWMEDVTGTVNDLSSGSATSVAWGNITGTITNQTDLISYLESNYIEIGDAAGGDLIGTYPNPELATITTAGGGVRPVISIDKKGRVTSLQGEEIRVISSDYVTIGNEVLLLSRSVTVTLNPNPVDLEQVRIKAPKTGGFKVKSSKAFDGLTYVEYKKSFLERNYIYSADLGEWRVF